MINFGNGLGSKYTNGAKSTILTDSDKKNQKNDHEALREASKSKRMTKKSQFPQHMRHFTRFHICK